LKRRDDMDPSARRNKVARVFNNDPELQGRIVVNDVIPTGTTLGSGSFGEVLEVSV
jgi:predicted amidophosphoribosyltransferase